MKNEATALEKAYQQLQLAYQQVKDSEEKYHSLFKSMDQGFCILEMIFDSANKPLDYRFLEYNIVFEKQTGLRDAVGKTARELVPNLEPYWFELYGNVALTGEATRFTEGSEAMGRFFEVFAFRIGGHESRKVALLFTDITERKKGEDAVKQSEQFFRNMVLQAPVAMGIFDGPSHVVVLANNRMFNIVGKKPEDVLDKPIFETLPEAASLGLQEEMGRVYTTGQPFIANELQMHLPRNGAYRTVFLNFIYEPYRNVDGAITGVVAVATDVTDQVMARRKIESAEQRAQLAIASADLGTYEIDLKTNEMYTSPRFQAIWEISDTMDRNTYAKKIHPDDLPVREKAMREAYTTGNLFYEARLIKSTGKIKWVRVRGTVLFDQEQKTERLLGVIQDITEQKLFAEELKKQVREQTQELMQAHSALIDTNDYLQNIINVFDIPLQVLQPVMREGDVVDFRYKLTNTAYAAYAGTSPKALENRPVSAFFPNYFKTDSFRKIAETYKTGKANKWENHYNVDGLDIYNEMSATIMNDDVVVHFTDYTVLKKLQLELVQKVDELQRSNQNLEEFAHAASHDLKEPIRKVHLFSNMLRQSFSSLDNEQQHLFERVEDAIKRMGLLIDDLLEYSHVSMGVDLLEEIDLNKKVAIVLTDLEVAIQERDAHISVGRLPRIKGQRRQLQQLFHNLIQNALKYSKEGVVPHIAITSELVKGSNTSFNLAGDEENKMFHLVRITDNGIGFEQAHAEQIFQMFKRLHGKSQYSGSGVGLAIVKKVVENHKGYIRAEGKPQEGATFNVLLPAG